MSISQVDSKVPGGIAEDAGEKEVEENSARTHPCLTPLLILNGCDTPPPERTFPDMS